MKHGDKKKGKASKAAGKKSSKASKSKVVKSVKSVKSGKAKGSVSTASKKASPRDDAGAARTRITADVGFSNAAVGAAFKQAVKKYPNAFRKLTD